MGSPKAALDWHGCPLLGRVTGIVARAVDGPVIVVRAPGQELPELDPAVEVVADPVEGRGPLQGLAAGLRAVGRRAPVAYLSSTDVPLLHPAFVRCVLGAWRDAADIVLPEIGGHRQPLAAAYRVGLAPIVEQLVDGGRLKPAFLFERSRVVVLDEAAVRRDAAVARDDPGLASVSDVNAPSDYERARALPAPEIAVDGPGGETVRAWTLGELVRAFDRELPPGTAFTLNGQRVASDPRFPLVAGDRVAFSPGPS
jgi:molybdopterin-guanine dinucleotide biosynthesis protein A